MFFGIGFLLYLLLIGYTYLRIRALFDTRLERVLFTVAYLILVLSFFAIQALSHSDAPPWIHLVILYGSFTLPYLLYLFLLVLLVDVLRVVNRLTKLVPRDKLGNRTVRTATVVLLFLLPAGIVISGNIWNGSLRVNEFQIEIPRRSAPAREVTIAVASDLHLGEITDPELMQRFADKVNSINADVLLLPGDILEGDRRDENLGSFVNQFRRIRTKYGLFASLGNHESHGREDKLTFFRNAAVTVLRDSAALIDGAFWLIGRNDNRSQGRKPVADLARTLPDTLPIVVLDHQPRDLQNIAAAGADIVVCGHTHNGQLWPINYITGEIYEVSWGYRKIGSLNVFVTSGVQVWGPPVRTAGDSEIMVIKVAMR